MLVFIAGQRACLQKVTSLLSKSPMLKMLPIGCAGAAEDIGRQILAYGRRIPKAEMFARVDAVDGDTIRAVADRFIYDQVQTSLGCENVVFPSAGSSSWPLFQLLVQWRQI